MPNLCQYQSTIANPIVLHGLGLHSGQNIKIKIIPAEEDTGIIFRRVDLPGSPTIPANFNYVDSTFMCTSLRKEFTISTVEHFLAAASGLSVDNMIVEVNGDELPILDGSSQHFVFMLQSAGIVQQNKKRKYITIKQNVTVRNGDAFIKLAPYNGLRINYKLDYNHPEFTSNNHHGVDFRESMFLFDIASARTFGFTADFSNLRKKGLIKGGSMDNALVFDQDKLLNPEGFRFSNECARHKILDVVGDLVLMGLPLLADLTCFKSGHTLNHMLAKQVLSDDSCYEVLEF